MDNLNDFIKNGTVVKPFSVQHMPINDVKPGMMVYSLNEKSGELEPARIAELIDMGTKPVFRLRTESGKEIRTTGNHPYLVKEYIPKENRFANSASENIQKIPLRSRELPAERYRRRDASAVERLGFELEEGDIVLEESAYENATWVKAAGLDVGDEILVYEGRGTKDDGTRATGHGK